MSYEAEQIGKNLRTARLARGLNQRELSSLTGIPQAQISRIEAGAVNLRFSSLTALAHALDFELTLVPKKVMPVVKSLIRSALPKNQPGSAIVQKEMRRISEAMRNLQIKMPRLEGLHALQKNLAELECLRLEITEPKYFKDIRKVLEQIGKPGREFENIAQKIQSIVKDLKNSLAHNALEDNPNNEPKPAYTLDEDD